MEINLDTFEFTAEEEEALAKARDAFIEGQEEVEASDECEGGACKL